MRQPHLLKGDSSSEVLSLITLNGGHIFNCLLNIAITHFLVFLNKISPLLLTYYLFLKADAPLTHRLCLALPDKKSLRETHLPAIIRVAVCCACR